MMKTTKFTETLNPVWIRSCIYGQTGSMISSKSSAQNRCETAGKQKFTFTFTNILTASKRGLNIII